ncbi:MAG: hypothetical protein GKR91_01655 [Pseudomonadales bacterium]|nr:hypothetical protein [Pseudomonadales bacterium]
MRNKADGLRSKSNELKYSANSDTRKDEYKYPTNDVCDDVVVEIRLRRISNYETEEKSPKSGITPIKKESKYTQSYKEHIESSLNMYTEFRESDEYKKLNNGELAKFEIPLIEALASHYSFDLHKCAEKLGLTIGQLLRKLELYGILQTSIDLTDIL